MVTVQKIYSSIFLTCFFISIAAPIFPGATGGMMYHVLLISLLPAVMLPWVLKMKMQFLLSFLLSIFIVLVMTCAALANEDGVNIASFSSSLKIFYFGIYVLMGYAYVTCSNRSVELFYNTYFWLIMVCIIVGLIELTVPSISYLLYKRESMEILDDKLSSIFNTTYHLAFFLFFGYLYYLQAFVSSLQNSKGKLLPCFIMLMAIISVILLTQSRMFVMMAALIAVFLFCVLMLKRINKPNVLLSLTVVVIVVCGTVIAFWDSFSAKFYYIVYGIDFLLSGQLDFSGDGIGSFNTRINQIIFSIDQIHNNPFVGVGSGKDIYLESLYAYLLYKYAVPGLVFYFVALYFLVKKINSILRMRISLKEDVFFKASYWFFLLSPLYFLSGPLFEVPKLSLFFFVLIGMVYGYDKLEKSNGKND
ncbi:O-antigen ligase family protein [Citrobacter sp. RHB25-C09]|uniref:O-antigen ligase family protein n=1 Tax=Citrobacter sp. RHB25-C09 TaxID=2742624 RepID=UPI0015EEB37B|nr:O-antigen ligase family protein [Citrobacter sp. RHB25-C09]QMI05660.1 O-antigen ligase family protein [Citrobacter sp. RHB25-C09]